ncbi:hypothetical protein [Pontiella sp.]|uniref:hypothetical protein n=1 Tax=Pontiella sp. TaxID=2837462 RepID=UPI0035620FC8
MRTNEAIAWEKRLKGIFDEIDKALEAQYRGRFNLHPSRPEEGRTSNPEMDGLINVGASFSAGFGSAFGPGYVVDIRISTLSRIPAEVKLEMRDTVQAMLLEKLPQVFPGRTLHVDKERNHLRIHGDLSLD